MSGNNTPGTADIELQDTLDTPEPDVVSPEIESKDSLFDQIAPKNRNVNFLVSSDDEEEDNNNENKVTENSSLLTMFMPGSDEKEDEVGSLRPISPKDEDYMQMTINKKSNPSYKSTLKRNQRAWVDPWEAAVKATFYHKELKSLRPTFDVVTQTIEGMDRMATMFNVNAHAVHNEDEEDVNPEDVELAEEEAAAAKGKAPQKFGPWDGVMAGCLLNIFGVIMFLRVGFVVGQAGIGLTMVIMLISSTVVILTALSMSAICTNGTILAGGAYYLISRALGPAVGGSVGILFSFGNMVAISMYLIGFAETLGDNLMQESGFSLTGDAVNDVRIWSNIVLIFVLILAIVGLKYVIKTQLILLVFISCAIFLFFVGAFYRTKTVAGDEVIFAMEGWTNGNLKTNLGPGFTDGYDFWSVLSIFFPAVTGIMAGANISGDLRNPSSDIPKGTLTAIGVSTVVYAFLAVFVGAVVARSELIRNAIVMSDICVWNYIVLIGIYAATLSSAIASLVGAPRILQAVAEDNIFPAIQYFAKGDKNGNPIRGYILSFFVAMACNCIGELNLVAPLISQFFMMTYLLINFACFFLEISHSPGWRPSFKYFNKYTSGFGALLCLVIMFLLNYMFAMVAGLLGGGIYLYVYYKDPEINWGAAPQSRKYFSAYTALLKLRKSKKHIKNWRPGFLVLCRDPIKRPQQMLFAQTLKKGYGPIFYATVHTGDYRTNVRKFHEAHSLGYLPENAPKNAKGFYEAILATSLRQGVQNLFQLCGLGSLRPNTLIIGFKKRWITDNDEIVLEYVQILRDTLIMGSGLMICAGFKRINWILKEFAPPALQHDLDDYPEMYAGWKPKAFDATYDDNSISNLNMNGRDHLARVATHSEAGSKNPEEDEYNPGYYRKKVFMPRTTTETRDALILSSAWAAGQQKDTYIDVWWMIDDGGLCMLVPYIMQLHSFWKRCQLRIMMVTDEDDISTDIGTMKQLIRKFRLPYVGPIVVTAKKNPHPNTVQRFERLAKMKLGQCSRPSVISKWLILSELLFEYSRYSGINVVTLPIPTKALKPRAYLAMLQLLSDQERLPPTIIMRGNGESTLTFYSE